MWYKLASTMKNGLIFFLISRIFFTTYSFIVDDDEDNEEAVDVKVDVEDGDNDGSAVNNHSSP